MTLPTHTRATHLALGLSALFGLAACGGMEEMEGDTDAALTTGLRVRLQNLATGRCMQRQDGLIHLATCDSAEGRQGLTLHPTTLVADLKTYTDGTGRSYCATRAGIGEGLKNVYCPTVTEVLLGAQVANPAQDFRFDALNLTDFVMKNPSRTACAGDDGGSVVRMQTCDGSARQQWRQLP